MDLRSPPDVAEIINERSFRLEAGLFSKRFNSNRSGVLYFIARCNQIIELERLANRYCMKTTVLSKRAGKLEKMNHL